jgi:hypothetical protein
VGLKENDMAGLIEQGMQPAPAPQAPMPEAPMPQNQQGGEVDPDSDPNYVTALKFAMQALYENGAAEKVAVSLKGAKDPVEALANTAYEMTSIVDERTEGAVPDELFALLATRILQEVADIAQAAGIKMRASDVALALKEMILRYMGEQGMDTSQLQQAMDQVDPSEFDRMAEQEA